MTDIREFLLARIAEDEAKVEYMMREKQRTETAPVFSGYPAGWLTGVDIFVSPDRWAAECDAKRRIVEFSRAMYDEADWYWVLERMAALYADHPDYDPGWAA